MSPLRSTGGFSTAAAGFDGRPHTFIARRKMPYTITSASRRVLPERPIDTSHCSIIGVVIDSIGISPNAGRSCERTSAR